MSFKDELKHAFTQLHTILTEDQSDELLSLTYAEFTLKCYIMYNDLISRTILCDNAPLTQSFIALGVDQPHDRMSLLLSAFYLHLRTDRQDLCSLSLP